VRAGSAKLIIYGLIPALGILGLLVFDLVGVDLRGALGGTSFSTAQVTGVVVVGVLAGVLCLGVTAYAVIKEVWRWNHEAPPES
jgi:hypothetical protein